MKVQTSIKLEVESLMFLKELKRKGIIKSMNDFFTALLYSNKDYQKFLEYLREREEKSPSLFVLENGEWVINQEVLKKIERR